MSRQTHGLDGHELLPCGDSNAVNCNTRITMGQQSIYPKELVFRGQQDSRGHAPLRVYDPVEPVTASPITDQQRREAVRGALMMQRQAQDWETFYREILGVDGLIAKIFPSQAQQRAFEKTPEYVEIQHMLAQLRARPQKRMVEGKESTKMITVRLPESLHSSLIEEASKMDTSMNKLCIAKLLQCIDKELIR